MSEKNPTEGAGTPETATGPNPNCKDCFNSAASLEIDRLLTEKEDLISELKMLQTSAVLEYSAISKTLIHHAGGINLFTIWVVDQWALFRQSLTELCADENAEELEALFEKFDYVIGSIRDGHDRISEYLVEKGDEFAAKNLSDSAQEVIDGYREINNWAKSLQKRITELEFGMPFYNDAINDFMKNREVEING